MITEKNKIELFNITKNLAYKDYIEAYKKSDRYLKGKYTAAGKERKFKGYSLGIETIEAYDLLKAANDENICNDKIEEIKGYILNKKLLDPNLLILNTIELI